MRGQVHALESQPVRRPRYAEKLRLALVQDRASCGPTVLLLESSVKTDTLTVHN
jgi:hypothetical protein